MFSIGCIFAELLHSIEPQHNLMPPRNRNRSILFSDSVQCGLPSNISYQSYDDVVEIDYNSREQLKAMCRTLGSPMPIDRSFLTDVHGQKYLEFISQNKQKCVLSTLFPSASKQAMNLLKGLLEFNPYFRMTAKEALQHPLFRKVR